MNCILEENVDNVTITFFDSPENHVKAHMSKREIFALSSYGVPAHLKIVEVAFRELYKIDENVDVHSVVDFTSKDIQDTINYLEQKFKTIAKEYEDVH